MTDKIKRKVWHDYTELEKSIPCDCISTDMSAERDEKGIWRCIRCGGAKPHIKERK